MSNSPMTRRSIGIMLAAMLFASASVTFAADAPPAAEAAPSKEMREKMAAAHDAMAACLRSDKSVADCRHEMQMKCQEMHGEQGCPMMGMGMREPMQKR